MKPANERPMTQNHRTQLDLRHLVDQYLKNGWVVSSRYPLTLERGRARKQERHGCLVDA
jgi:hypothetical protein